MCPTTFRQPQAWVAVWLLLPTVCVATPVSFHGGATLVAEYGAGTMIEAQAFYSPCPRWPAGVGYLRLEDEDETLAREIDCIRLNLLLGRVNQPRAQGNVYA